MSRLIKAKLELVDKDHLIANEMVTDGSGQWERKLLNVSPFKRSVTLDRTFTRGGFKITIDDMDLAYKTMFANETYRKIYGKTVTVYVYKPDGETLAETIVASVLSWSRVGETIVIDCVQELAGMLHAIPTPLAKVINTTDFPEAAINAVGRVVQYPAGVCYSHIGKLTAWKVVNRDVDGGTNRKYLLTWSDPGGSARISSIESIYQDGVKILPTSRYSLSRDANGWEYCEFNGTKQNIRVNLTAVSDPGTVGANPVVALEGILTAAGATLVDDGGGGLGGMVALGQTTRDWMALAAAPNGDIYASVFNDDIYIQAGGTGNFTALSQTTRDWRGMAAAPNGDIYFCVYGGDIYMRTAGAGDFAALSQTSRSWTGMAAAPNGDIYACVEGGDIYVRAGGIGDFTALSQTSRQWSHMAAAPSGDIYATNGDDIYKRTAGAGDFTALGQTDRDWTYMAVTSGGALLAVAEEAGASGVFIYIQPNTTDDLELLVQTSRNWSGLAINSSDEVYGAVLGGDIYKQESELTIEDFCTSMSWVMAGAPEGTFTTKDYLETWCKNINCFHYIDSAGAVHIKRISFARSILAADLTLTERHFSEFSESEIDMSEFANRLRVKYNFENGAWGTEVIVDNLDTLKADYLATSLPVEKSQEYLLVSFGTEPDYHERLRWYNRVKQVAYGVIDLVQYEALGAGLLKVASVTHSRQIGGTKKYLITSEKIDWQNETVEIEMFCLWM